MNEAFQAKLTAYLSELDNAERAKSLKHFPLSYAKGWHNKFTSSTTKRGMIKVTMTYTDGQHVDHSTAFCFINPLNGNIHRAAGFNRPEDGCIVSNLNEPSKPISIIAMYR